MKRQLIAIASVCLLSACQTHLPPLETSPGVAGPNITDVVQHIQCELATIVNYNATVTPTAKDDQALYDRLKPAGPLLPYLTKYHFVATVQLSLEVTDNEGFTPSLTYINASGQGMFPLGGQLTGTQDRSLTLNYAIDLEKLADTNDEHGQIMRYKDSHCPQRHTGAGEAFLEGAGLTGAIAGNLGMADIVADGLTALQVSQDSNIYTSTGPVPPAITRQLNSLSGDIVLPSLTKDGKTYDGGTFNIKSVDGTILLAPQAAGSSTPGSVSLSALMNLEQSGNVSLYIVNWSGSILPPDKKTPERLYFSLTGNLTPIGTGGLPDLIKEWGFTPTITLTGTLDNFNINTLQMSGAVGPVAGSLYEKGGLITMQLETPSVASGAEEAPPAPSGPAPQAAKAGATPSSAAGGSSFGSLVDFTLVYGLNGGPTWTFKRFKGPAGATTPLLAATRTRLDSLAITFVASCQDFSGASATPNSYWQSLAPCDDLNSAVQQGASVGYENNSLMLLRNFLVRP